MDALNLVDYDCWRHVFRQLDAEDLVSCGLVCKPFSRLVEEKRFQQKWKFHLALPLIFDHLGQWDEDNFDTSWMGLYNSRLVCHSWRHSVDKYVSEKIPPLLEDHSSLPLSTRFTSAEQIGEFLQEFGGWNGSPFPSKSVFITITDEPDEDAAVIQWKEVNIQMVTNIGERFGIHIHTFELFVEMENVDYLFTCKVIKRSLMHLPNLNTFIVMSDWTEDWGEEQEQELVAWIEGNELADLPRLRVLEIQGLNERIEKYLVEKYAPQLTHFGRAYVFPPDNLKQFQPQQFGNLRELSLELENHADALGPLRFLNSPVKLVNLKLSNSDDEPLTWNMDVALRNLKHLPIDSLKIQVSTDINLTEAGLAIEDYLNESIQTLSIHFPSYVYDEKVSFNFLEALQKVEKLKLKFDSNQWTITHPKGVIEEIKLNEYIKLLMEENEVLETFVLYGSNVWEKVPSLKTLNVEENNFFDTFTREEYEQRK